jgi:hypothetical protein
MKKVFKTVGIVDEETNTIELTPAWDVIMKVVNKRRPYAPSDFVKEYFIPDI